MLHRSKHVDSRLSATRGGITIETNTANLTQCATS